jgi:predicted HTH domain antitoxin
MSDVTVSLPDELLHHLSKSKLGKVIPEPERVRVALAIQLFVTKEVSLGRASELAGIAYVDLMHLLSDLGLPSVSYTIEDLEQDRATSEELVKQLRRDRGLG